MKTSRVKYPARFERFDRSLSIRRVDQRQALPKLPVQTIIGVGTGRRCGNHAQFAAALRSQRKRQFIFFIRLTKNDFQLGCFCCPHEANRTELTLGVAVHTLEFLCDTVADAHDHAAFNLPLYRLNIDRRTDIKGGNCLFDAALFIQNNDLCTVGIGNMADGGSL